MTRDRIVYIMYIQMKEIDFSGVTGFQRDEGNLGKNWEKHGVSAGECEEVFFNEPFFACFDERHSFTENRYFILGETNENRRLFIVFTVRETMIRVISARDMHRNERKEYEKLKKGSEVQERER